MSDITPAYEHALANRRASASQAASLLAGQTVVFVRGFLSESVLTIGEMLRELPELQDREFAKKISGAIPGFAPPLTTISLGRYFDDQIEWLGAQQISHRAVVIESEAPISVNADVILREIENPEQRITIISHSKGCLDVLEALLRRPPEAWSHIVRWIAIQGPFYGTPIADFIADRPALLAIADAALSRVLGGSVESLTGMRIDLRDTYHRDHKGAIDALLTQVPTVCQGTSIASTRLRETFLGASLLLIEALRGANDGLVPIESAILPGACSVTRSDVDHAMPVMESLRSFERVENVQALICALEEKRTGRSHGKVPSTR